MDESVATGGWTPRVQPDRNLAVLVPLGSPSFNRLKAGGRTLFPALWAALREPGSAPVVVADEFCLEGLFHRELGHAPPLPPPPFPTHGGGGGGGHQGEAGGARHYPLLGDPRATEDPRDARAFRWNAPVLRNYWCPTFCFCFWQRRRRRWRPRGSPSFAPAAHTHREPVLRLGALTMRAGVLAPVLGRRGAPLPGRTRATAAAGAAAGRRCTYPWGRGPSSHPW